MLTLSDEDLLARLTDTENPTVERKVHGDAVRDVLKTAVGFANSLPVGAPGVLFTPVYDDGRVQETYNLDSLQKDLSKKLQMAYPPIFWEYKLLRANGIEFLALLVWGSESRPHFAGPAFIRDGSQTVAASASQFQRLIDMRSSKVTELLRWRGREVTAEVLRIPRNPGMARSHGKHAWRLIDCNQFFASFEHDTKGAVSLSRIELSYDFEADRLLVEIS